MQYRNDVTGAVIDTECAVSGEHWEEVSLPPGAPAAREGEVKPRGLRSGNGRRKPVAADVGR